MNFQEVPIADITVSNSRRKTTPERVQAMAESIQEIGLQNPVGLTESKRLIHGRHRLEACQSLGWTAIPATIQPLDDIRAEIAEIDENIQRSNYTALEEAKATAKRKELYEALHPETKTPGRGKNQHVPTDKMATGTEAPSFADDTAAKTGRSARSVRRDAEIGAAISDAAAVQLHGTAVADNKTQLKQLADLPEEAQAEVARQIGSGKAKTVSEAKRVAKIVDKPKSGQQQKDPRLWGEIEGMLGKTLQRADELNRQFPHAVLHRMMLSQVKQCLATLKSWKEAAR